MEACSLVERAWTPNLVWFGLGVVDEGYHDDR